VNNGIGLILAIVLAFALVASLFVLVYVIRKSPGRTAAQSGPVQSGTVQSGTGEAISQSSSVATQLQLDEAARAANQVRAQAESDAAAIVRKAEAAAEQVAQGRQEVEEEIRTVKDEVRQLRADLERRETRLAEREQRMDDEARKVDQRSADLDRIKQDLEVRGKDLDRLDEERRDVL
jgi:ribonuclease Y